MKHIIKVETLQGLPETRPLIAMDVNKNLKWEGVSAGPQIEMVDLGLSSGTLWAKTNIGAETETDYGQYFQWAADNPLHVEGTSVNPAADWNLCPYCTDPIDGRTFSKYTGSDYDTLQTEDDAAASQFTSYRMPTQEDFQELINETDNDWTSINGVQGWKFTNKLDSSKYIFLPMGGNCVNDLLNGEGMHGNYWASSLIENGSSTAYRLNIKPAVTMGSFTFPATIDISTVERKDGHNVRPVY